MDLDQLLTKFDQTLFVKWGGSCFECCDYEAMREDLAKTIVEAYTELIDENYDLLLEADQLREELALLQAINQIKHENPQA